MKKRFKAIFALVLASGLTIGWNLQNQQVAEALLGSNSRIDGYTGAIANNGSFDPKLSNDGNLIVFSSNATNFVSGDTNGVTDVFLRNIPTGTTSLISKNSSGTLGDGKSGGAVLSGDGKYVVYSSSASNLVAGDTNGKSDIFKYNISNGTTERISVDSSGMEANGESAFPDSDNEGRFVTFTSSASNLTSVTDLNGDYDVFVKDTLTGIVTHISQTGTSNAGNNYSSKSKISCDGRYVGFTSTASNLISNDTNGQKDAYLADTLGSLVLTNITRTANSHSDFIDISCDGNYLLINSLASNLGVDPYPGAGTLDVFRYKRSSGSFEGVSIRENGTDPIQTSVGEAISSDGRYILFRVAGSSFLTSMSDTNGADDILLRDMSLSTVKLVSKTPTNNVGSHYSNSSSFSGTNRIAFASQATDLVTSGASDNNGQQDIFYVDAGTQSTCTF